jgi:hypothetical protein
MTVFPADNLVTLIVCETIREEKAGKLSLLGVFPGGKLIVGLDVTVITLPMSFVFFVNDGEGAFKSSVSLKAPDGVVILDGKDLSDTQKNPDASAVVMVMLVPFQTDQIGTFTVSLHLDDRIYERSFSIQKGVLPT